MGRSTIVHDYAHPTRGSTQTLTLDENILASILQNDIKRPKGYTVSYHTNPETEKRHFGQNHPMKPWRLTLTNKIVYAYGMQEAMDVYLSRAATPQELMQFHTREYVEALQSVSPYRPHYTGTRDALGTDDCPIFDGMFSYASLHAGASLDAAFKLTSGQSQIAINWSGGLHHAHKTAASGFCYVNDIVLAIQHLLLYHPRVLYIDIDVHHGDGVEEAFWSTDRVMTLSFHMYDPVENFFPGTGSLDITGPVHPSVPGAHHSLNCPLNAGIEDSQYTKLFEDVVRPIVESYQPTCIVLQCGADSLGGDRLGKFNINVQAHGNCVSIVKSFGLPTLILGGGGYTPRNVARAWAYETSIAIGMQDIDPNLPSHTPFLNHFAPDKSLFPPLSEFKKCDNRNDRKYLDSLVTNVKEQLRYIQGAPSVQMRDLPTDFAKLRMELEQEFRESRSPEEEDAEQKKLEAGRGIHGELLAT